MMNNVEFNDDEIDNDEYSKMLAWCINEIGECVWERTNNMSESKPWAVRIQYKKIIFKFYNDTDAVMFKLRWL
jgi:hypothetical protein